MYKINVRGSSLSFALLLGWLLQSTAASAQDSSPTYGTLVGENDGDLLNFECREIGSEKIECDFVQVLLKPRSTDDDYQNSLETIPDLLNDMKAEEGFCKFFVAYKKAVNGEKIDDPELKNQIDSAIKERAAARLQDPRSLEKTQMIEDATLALCTSPSIETARKFLEANHNALEDVCEPTFNRYTQQYVRVSSELWVVESSPFGECGVINTSRFIADPKYPLLWSHEASKVVSNKTGGTIIQCRDLDENPQPYYWNSGPVLKNCTYID